MSLPKEMGSVNLDLDHSSRKNLDEILDYFPEGIRENVKAKIESLIATASKKEISEDEKRGRKEVYGALASWYNEKVLNRLSNRDNQGEETNPVKSGILEALTSLKGEAENQIPPNELRAIEDTSDRIWKELPKIPPLDELLAQSKKEGQEDENDNPLDSGL